MNQLWPWLSRLVGRSVDVHQGKSYRPEIDGIRAIAVLAVIGNHFNPHVLPGGYLGVDVFFVVSGYVITSSLSRAKESSFSDFLSVFYAKRFKRLMPALAVMVLLVSILIQFVDPSPGAAIKTGIASLFGLSNLYLLRSSVDYFAHSTALNPFTHTWSLGVEEQFYLVFPFVLWFTGFTRSRGGNLKQLLAVLLLIAVPSLLAFIGLHDSKSMLVYFSMPTRFWEMAVGCFAYILCASRLGSYFQKVWLAWASLLILIAAICLPSSVSIIATPIVVFSIFLFLSSQISTSFVFNMLTQREIRYVGLISYSLYLWHWPVVSLSQWSIGIHWWSFPIQLLCIFILAMFSYHAIETPSRNQKWIKSNRSVNVISIAMIASLSFLIGFLSKMHSQLYLGHKNRINDLNYSEEESWDHANCQNYVLQTELPQLNHFSSCWIEPTPLSNENVGDSAVDKTIFVYGDSYAEQMIPALDEIKQRNQNLAINAYFSAGCIPSSAIASANEAKPGHCGEVFFQYLDWLQLKSKPGDIVLIFMSFERFTEDKPESPSGIVNNSSRKFLSGKNAIKEFSVEIKNVARKLQQKHIQLILASGIPVLTSDPKVCGNRFSQLNPKCDRSIYYDIANAQENLAISDYLRVQGQGAYEIVDLVSPMIKAISDSKSPYDLYFNQTHLSRSGALSLSPVLQKVLLGNKPKRLILEDKT